jgi:RNA polymerase sigma-70 factor (ECF subfamily)
MAALSLPDTEELLRQAESGDKHSVDQLLDRHRRRLRQMVAVRMDPRLRSRLDASDVVQDTLAEAHRRLPEYLQTRPLPFYPWLRQIAWNRLVDLHRRHVRSRRRAVGRDVSIDARSAARLLERLASSGSVASRHVIREELRRRVQDALAKLSPTDREVIVLRHFEQLAVADVAAVLEVPEGTVKSRHFRALERLQRLLVEEAES